MIKCHSLRQIILLSPCRVHPPPRQRRDKTCRNPRRSGAILTIDNKNRTATSQQLDGERAARQALANDEVIDLHWHLQLFSSS